MKDVKIDKEAIEMLIEGHKQDCIKLVNEFEDILDRTKSKEEYIEISNLFLELLVSMRFNLAFFISDRLDQLKKIRKSDADNIVRLPKRKIL